MHVARLARLRRNLADERGFTLVELLVVLMLSTIVSGATLAIVIVSVHLSSNQQDRIDSNQQGRIALEKITQALNTSCVSPGLAPVLAGSTSTSLVFYSIQNDSPAPLPYQVTISLSPTPIGSLVMSSQSLTGSAGNPSSWAVSTSQPTNFTLLKYAAAGVIGGSTQPLFQYYSYNPIGTPSLISLSGNTALTAAQASSVVMVTVNLQALPSDAWNTNAGTRAADFTDSVILRLSPASTAAGASNSPCT